MKLTDGIFCESSYFTQRLLPDFIEQHPELTKNWDVVFDARGHLQEPHTGDQIELGTLNVRAYKRQWESGFLERPDGFTLDSSIPTCGPTNRYNFVLFVEKEGFNPLLVRARISSRFDVAIMSTKGMSVTAARWLVERLSEQGVTTLVLRDFDKSGFSIVHTLRSDTRRYQYKTKPLVIDLGLRLEDVLEMNLAGEPVTYKGSLDRTKRKDPRDKLRECGATEEECDFLVTQATSSGWKGRRVELNEMISQQFIDFLERKLIGAGVKKLVPSKGVLAQAYRRAWRIAIVNDLIQQALRQNGEGDSIRVPPRLAKKVADRIKDTPMAWDEAIAKIVAEDR
jgi:hypothetical protein